MWEKHRTYEAVNDFVIKSTRDSLIGVGNSYPAATAIVRQQDIGDAVAKDLRDELARYGIVIDSVSVTAIDLDSSAQNAVDARFTARQNVDRAREEQERARIDAATVALRTEEGALSPEANQRFCLDVVNAWDVKKNGNLPATFDCSLESASDPQVIVDGTNP